MNDKPLDTVAQSSSLDQLVSSLPREKQPDRDLWTGIDYAISQAQLGNSKHATPKAIKMSIKPIYALAASVCLIAVVGVFSFQSGKSASGQALVQQLSEQHLAQKNALIVNFEGRPAVTENWQAQLQELDDAAVAIKKALANDPNNTALLKMLKKVHQQQIMLIERVHAPAWQQI